MKRWQWILLLLFIGFMIFTNPDGTAHMFRIAGGVGVKFFSALGTFFSRLIA